MTTEKPAGKETQAQKILFNGLNLTPVFKGRSVSVDAGVRAHFAEVREALNQLERAREALHDTLKNLDSMDQLGSFQINQLMSDYNQAESLASSVAKKMKDTVGCMINKI